MLQRSTALPSQQSIIPAVAGCVMLGASVLPWLTDPLQGNYSAWKLPIDIGWQFHVEVVNYGLLCLCCALYAFCVAYAHWKPFRGSNYFVRRNVSAGLLCLLPIALFLLQYLCADIHSINQLAQHKIQMLLIRQHFGYRTTPERIIIQPFALDAATLQGRLALLANQISIGLVLPFLSAYLLLGLKRPTTTSPGSVATKKHPEGLWFASIATLVLVLGIVLARAPAAIACEYQARLSLDVGDYTSALSWLDVAHILNPELDQLASYHIERGQAWYFLYPDQHNQDTYAYLAFVYQQRGDDLNAYQQLHAISPAQSPPSWVVDEMSNALERSSEFTKSLGGSLITRPAHDDTALPWLQLLTQVDPSNVYGEYLVGRIQYDLHDYSGCTEQMVRVIELTSNRDVQSSAYTYMALSDAGKGDYLEERTLLFKAEQLDPNYYNNTARQELSGLH